MSANRPSAVEAKRGQGTRCVAEMMKTALVTITPDTVVASAHRLAAKHRADYLIVLDNGALTGIVCETDLHRPGRTGMVREHMSSPVFCIGPETTLDEAATIMSQNEIGCLPVVSDSFLVGIVTESDLRASGVGDEAADGRCAACKQARPVFRHPRAGGAYLCRNCLAEPSDHDDDTGTSAN